MQTPYARWKMLMACIGLYLALTFPARVGAIIPEAEDFCQTMGQLAAKIAEGRDAGLSQNQARALLNQSNKQTKSFPGKKALRQYKLDMIDLIYRQRMVTPGQFGEAERLDCLQDPVTMRLTR